MRESYGPDRKAEQARRRARAQERLEELVTPDTRVYTVIRHDTQAASWIGAYVVHNGDIHNITEDTALVTPYEKHFSLEHGGIRFSRTGANLRDQMVRILSEHLFGDANTLHVDYL